MRAILAILLTVPLLAVAANLGHQAPPKPAATYPVSTPDPATMRQGGDTFADALAITLYDYYEDTGTTIGYTDDYDEACPYTQSTSPDVVYTFTPSTDTNVDIDMLGSSYDTKIYVYDGDLALVACNDDFYPDYVSKLENLPLLAGVQYYLVIDGYGGDAGEYQLAITQFWGEYVPCQVGSVLEDEPPLINDYIDLFNGGCNSLGDLGFAPFQHIGSTLFCGQAGWYLSGDGTARDTDWFTLTIPPGGALTIIGDATWGCYMFELGPMECDQVAVIQSQTIGPISEGTMTITGAPGSTAWFWVGATTFESPGGNYPEEFTYMLWLPEAVSTAVSSWSEVKALFD